VKYFKKSLGQNFLFDKNIIKKIINLTNIKNRNVIEIGPGRGALTDEILKKKPKSLILIEKDFNLAKELIAKYNKVKFLKVHNKDILQFNIEKIVSKESLIFGNLPYNISSQILIKFLKFNKWPPRFSNIIFMFQKELGEKIIGKFLSKNYGRLSIITSYRLNMINKFFVSPQCFFPRPKVTSIVINFEPKKNNFSIKNINNLEKITNILFSNKRKMINKNIKKILNENEINKIQGLDVMKRPSEIRPENYYKITEFFEKK
jgi:16S rRNA (adenine1518-N6/adenine1519-N6)-dimethyltransferase